ncbi:MAG: hypothetical protein ACYTHJ_07800 [Planctomycetota bacterium]|jgi:hypothetical protein
MATSISGRSGTSGRGGKISGSPIAIPRSYKNVNQCFQGKIDSFKTLYQQTCGSARYPRPKTSVLNSFANWINKGAVIQTVSCAQLAKWAKSNNANWNNSNPTTMACKNVLTKKFGKSPIKACARTKTGGFMVATSPTWKGKTFRFPTN